MIGGQPCDGDTFNGGAGANDSASFARVHNSGVAVEATIGGTVTDPDVGGCNPGHITSSTEKIEGSPGNDILTGDNGPNTLLGRGGNDKLDGKGGFDDCVGGGGDNSAVNCEKTAEIP
jgi:Ca2+-binding RTX toxin-like protein